MPASPPSPPFLRAKLRALRPPPDAIERERLHALRDQAGQMRLVTLTAPGGFGKSTLAASWLAQWQRQGHACAWLSIAQEDDEPAQWLYSLVQALQGLGQGVGQAALALLQGRALAAPRTVLALLLNDLEDFAGQAFVVLDDYHCLQDASIHEALGFFITHAPPQLHLILTSRTSLALPLARLRAQGLWLEVDAAALRFDMQECTAFLAAACSQPPSAEQVAQWHAHTEGWPAALRLAALSHSLNGRPGPQAVSHSAAFASLAQELLSALPEASVHFMAQTALLERLSPSLCDAVRASDNSARHLQVLLHYNLLAELQDGDGTGQRYHPLLREHLLTTVCPRLGIDLPQAHRRAAHWFATQGGWSDAVRHALQAQDGHLAISWLAHCGMDLVRKGDLLTLLAWRRQLPPELLAGHSSVQLAIAWGLALAMRFDELEPLLQHIAQTHTDDAPDIQGQCLAIRACSVALQDDSLQAQALVEQWQALGSPGDAFTHNSLSNVMRFVYWKAGQLQAVYEQPWACSSQQLEQQNAFSTLYRHALLGSVELQQGRLGLAERHAREALRHVEQHGGLASVSGTLVAPLLAMLHYLRGEGAQAQALLQPLLPLLDATAMSESAIQTYQVLVGVARQQGQLSSAYELLERAETLGYNRGWDRLVGAMLLQRTQLLLQEGRLDEANAMVVRLRRMSAQQPAHPPCARAQLHQLHGIAQARLALASQPLTTAIEPLSALAEQARASQQVLLALQLDACLALAYGAAGEQAASLAALHRAVLAVQRSGAVQLLRDEGPELSPWLTRFLASNACDAALEATVRPLLAQPAWAAAASPNASTAATLTQRECEVIRRVERGQANKEIARAMAISSETVKTHLRHIFEKLGVQQRAQAVLVARALGLLDQEAPLHATPHAPFSAGAEHG